MHKKQGQSAWQKQNSKKQPSDWPGWPQLGFEQVRHTGPHVDRYLKPTERPQQKMVAFHRRCIAVCWNGQYMGCFHFLFHCPYTALYYPILSQYYPRTMKLFQLQKLYIIFCPNKPLRTRLALQNKRFEKTC